jgi:hypothetical protein
MPTVELLGAIVRREEIMQERKAIWIAKWEGPQHQGVYYAEHTCTRADTDCESGHNKCRLPRTATPKPKGVLHIMDWAHFGPCILLQMRVVAVFEFPTHACTHQRTHAPPRAGGPGQNQRQPLFRCGRVGCRNFPALYISPPQGFDGVVYTDGKMLPPLSESILTFGRAAHAWDSCASAFGRACAGVSIGVSASLKKMKGDFDGDLDPDGVTVLHGRFKLPGLHGVDGIFVKSHAKALQHTNMAGMAVLFHY